MYHARTAVADSVRICFFEHVIIFSFSVRSVLVFACRSAIEDKTESVLDVAVIDSAVCFAPIVELIVPIVVAGTRLACNLSLCNDTPRCFSRFIFMILSICPTGFMVQAIALFHNTDGFIDRGASTQRLQ